MSKRELNKLTKNNQLLKDILGTNLFEKYQRQCSACKTIDQIMDRMDLEMSRLAA